MYELEYVKKRKRKKRVAIAGGISVIVISALSIVAFLGRFVGTFTVSLDTGTVKLALSERSDFLDPTSYLRVADLVSFQEYTYGYILDKGHDVVDNENYDYSLGYNGPKETAKSMNFFKYTFFVKNVGNVPCRYDFTINIVDQTASEDGRYLDDTLRVMIYENKKDTDHNYTVYGKRSTTPRVDEEGNVDYRSPITVEEDDATSEEPFRGYAEMFESAKVITSFSVGNFDISDVRRYTIVTWLEGYRTSNLLPAPKGAKLKLGVKINAYEI